MWVADASKEARLSDQWRTDTLGISDDEREILSNLIEQHERQPFPVDPVISVLVMATSGYMYSELQNRLPSVPIPELRLPVVENPQLLLDIGCNWGRWSIAAAKRGYKVVGIDPSLGAVLAASRLAKIEGVDATFVVGDARCLPFRDQSFDAVFSYSVIQHFSEENAQRAISQAMRVLGEKGVFRCQMASSYGIRSFFHIARRGFRKPSDFEVRYYSPFALKKMFHRSFATVDMEVDAFFGLGVQPSDAAMLTSWKRRIVVLSNLLTALSRMVPPLRYAADSLYLVGKR
ncbi:MAG: class I SAM-dependent methyltransferase [Casimicrobium sp.]